MTDWTAGYMADVGYTYGYYTELNPTRVKLAFAYAGLVAPEIGTACELGFGQGLTANLHAAASVVEWHGTDFNPAQAALAQELASAAGSSARLYDEAFADFANRSDLPDFDYIALHGIWSWISDENRSVIVDFIRRKLKVGGVLYVSYNTMPGWAPFAPVRHLMNEHARIIGAEGHGIVNRVNGAIDFTERLLKTNPLYARAYPTVADRIHKLRDKNRVYLAHEYFNDHWHPMHFATMAEWLLPAKVTFACSACYLDHVDAPNLTPEQQALLKEIPDAMFRESTRDFMVNQQFRRDYWVKGARRLSALEQAELLRQQRLVLTTRREDVSLKISGAAGEATLSSGIYNPILDALADHEAKSVAQLEVAVRGAGVSFVQLAQALIVLTHNGHLAAVQQDAEVAKAKECTSRLNAHLIDKARGSSDISHLASPVTGGGIKVGRFQQLFLLAMGQGQQQPADWAQSTWQILAMQGQRVAREGRSLESAEENLAELTAQAASFAAEKLPILRALQVA